MTRAWPIFLCLALTGCSRSGGGPDSSLAARIPSDTVLLAGLRLEALRNTRIYQKHLEGRRLTELDALAGRASFNPRKDVRETLFAFDGRSPLLLAKGRFSNVSISGAERVEHRGVRLWRIEQWWVAFPDDETAVAGAREVVERVLDGPGGGGKTLLDRAGKLPGSAHAWMVFDGAAFRGEMIPEGNLSNFSRVLRSLSEASFYLDVADGLKGELAGRCQNEKEARTLSDAVRGLAGIARLSVPPDQPEALRFYDGFTVSQQEDQLSIRIRVPENSLSAFLAYALPERH